MADYSHIFTITPREYPAAIRPQQIAFIGMGVMGAPMAAHLLAAGHSVRVFNRNADKARAWAQHWAASTGHRAQWAGTVEQAVADADAVIACVGRDADVRGVCVGEGASEGTGAGNSGAFAHMKPDAIFIDHTTTSAELARDMHESARTRGVHFVDAPVSGGQAGAQRGQLSIMCGGETGAVERARAFMQLYARAITHMGDVGAGQLTKMVNQITLAGLIQGLAEAVAFAQKNGLDIERVLQATGQGAAQSWQMDNRAATMAAGRFDFGFAVDWMRKDLGIALAQARASGAQLPVTALVDQFYAQVQAAGGGRWDTSSLITRLK